MDCTKDDNVHVSSGLSLIRTVECMAFFKEGHKGAFLFFFFFFFFQYKCNAEKQLELSFGDN